MTNDQKIIRNKLGLLHLAETLSNVSQAGKVMAYSRDSFSSIGSKNLTKLVVSWPCAKNTVSLTPATGVVKLRNGKGSGNSVRSPTESFATLMCPTRQPSGMLPAVYALMFYFIIAQLFSLLLDCFVNRNRTDQQKDLEILLLRQQLLILQRHQPTSPRLSRWKKLGLAVLAAKFVDLGQAGKTKFAEALHLFKPDTVLKWHRELVRRKWTFSKPQTGGRPATDSQLLALLLRLANENPTWGYGKLQGELLKLGYKNGRSTIRDILKRQQVPPVPERAKKGSSWGRFLSHYRQQSRACDFFTVQTAWFKTLYLFFLHRAGQPAGAFRRLHGSSNRRMGDPAGAPTALDIAGRAETDAFLDPRP